MIKLAARVASLSESVTLAIDAKAKAMKSQGIDVVNFGAGEPDFDTPAHIKEAAKKALDAGKTKYAPAAGLPELKAALAEKFQRDNGLSYKPSQISVNVGGKHSLFNAIMALVDRGDQVIIPAPYWVSYYEMVHAAEGTPVILPATADEDFKISPQALEAAITPRTVAVILNSPSNPTGSVYTAAELEALAEVIIKKDIVCISDELYEYLIYDNLAHVSIAGVRPGMLERTLVVNGFSKAYSMTGWRLGYCAGPQPLIDAINTLQSHSTSNATTFCQWAALEALKGSQEDVQKMKAAFDQRRKLLVEGLRGIPGVKCTMPAGAFYAFPDMSAFHGRKTPDGKVIGDSLQLAEYVLEDAKVGIVPGAAFGADAHQRFSYATSNENIEKGLGRLKESLAKLV
ncbi:MAG: pyridoxal phosphate-dependent aminotransferase [Candidatus Sumerlaeaceae bacterium]|nr:pyridoxal phosphate-dependent aminotransferase [Candidatus Sumerlaeaceae bacterium]